MNTIIADETVATTYDTPTGTNTLEQRFMLRSDGLVIRYHRYCATTPWSTRPGSTTLGRAAKKVIADPELFADYITTRKGWVGPAFTWNV